MVKRTAQVFLIFFLLYLAGFLISQAQADGPRLLIPQTTFDFGYVPPNSKISHYYLVKNVGDDTLKIENVKPG